ncbi:hypothetical protein [Oricola sp.]|uniref:hypothetical protein n=1 Tax=Oricola sp. TaxID=1979950 RepID=UPI003BAA90E9
MIVPWVDHSRRRLGPIPEQVWRDPYMIGFLAMLITLAARNRTDNLIADEALGLVQLQVWGDITGVADSEIGEAITLLSTSRNVEFGAGCENALKFLQLSDGAPDPSDPDIAELYEMPEFQTGTGPDPLPGFDRGAGPGGLIAAALWQRYFEAHIPETGAAWSFH